MTGRHDQWSRWLWGALFVVFVVAPMVFALVWFWPW